MSEAAGKYFSDTILYSFQNQVFFKGENESGADRTVWMCFIRTGMFCTPTLLPHIVNDAYAGFYKLDLQPC